MAQASRRLSFEQTSKENSARLALLSGQQDAGAINPGPPELPQFLASFPAFLALVEKQAPGRLAQIARDLSRAPSDSWSELLNNFWSAPEQLSEQEPEPSEFLALAFLQPYAEFVRGRLATATAKLHSCVVSLLQP